MAKKLSELIKNNIIKTIFKQSNSHILHSLTIGGGIGTGQEAVQSEQLHASAL
jgi:hypothetical protein